MYQTCYFQHFQGCHEVETVIASADSWEQMNSEKLLLCFTDMKSTRTLHEEADNLWSGKVEKCNFLYLTDSPHIFYNDYNM